MVTTISFRCYFFCEGDQWIASCVDLYLASQSDDYITAIRQLSDQMDNYVCDLWEEDAHYAESLLNRKAHFTAWLHYYWQQLASLLGLTKTRFFMLSAPFDND